MPCLPCLTCLTCLPCLTCRVPDVPRATSGSAFALIDGKSVRIGEGWPVEISNSWSSPTWVVRILQNEGVPYAFNFDLEKKYDFNEDKYKKHGTQYL